MFTLNNKSEFLLLNIELTLSVSKDYYKLSVHLSKITSSNKE